MGRLVTVLLSVVLAASACSEDKQTALSEGEFVEQANAVCEEAGDGGTVLPPSEIPSDKEGLLKLVGDIHGGFVSVRDELGELDPPRGDKARVGQVLKDLDSAIHATDQTRRQIEDASDKEVGEILEDLEAEGILLEEPFDPFISSSNDYELYECVKLAGGRPLEDEADRDLEDPTESTTPLRPGDSEAQDNVGRAYLAVKIAWGFQPSYATLTPEGLAQIEPSVSFNSKGAPSAGPEEISWFTPDGGEIFLAALSDSGRCFVIHENTEAGESTEFAIIEGICDADSPEITEASFDEHW